MYTRLRASIDKKDQGFTLIELLVVIIIIGILAAVAIPAFLNQRKKGIDASMKSDARSVATELETFYTDSQAYPVDAELSVGTAKPVVVTIGTATVTLSPGNTATVSTNAAAATTSTAAAAATAFCVVTSNPAGTRNYVWVSNAGGMQASSVTACPSGFTAI